jgi:glycosyltransferase involved in cell wall biosynthesis
MKAALRGPLAVIFERIGPYHFARLRALGAATPTTAIETTALDQTYGWDLVAGAEHFERVTLFNATEAAANASAEIARRVHVALDRCRPAAVAVPGWSDPAALGGLQWCAARKVPAIMMADSTAWDHPRVAWKEWIKRRVLRFASAALVAGTPHAEYLTQLGMDPKRIFDGYDVVDNDYFTAGARQARNNAVELRKQHGLPENYWLASARFVEKKNLPCLVAAYAKYRDQAGRTGDRAAVWKLVLLGDGPLRESLRRQCDDLGLAQDVVMPGFKQYAELPIYYGLARAFVLTSTTEQWGLVVNEAMASALPAIVSNRCGCARDLVKEGQTGAQFDPQQPDKLAEILLRYASQPDALAAMGRAAETLIAEWNLDRFVNGLRRAAAVAVEGPAPSVTLGDGWLLRLLLRKGAA